MSLRKRLFAWFFHTFLGGHANLDDPFTRDIRAPLLAQAQGRVLEIGAGDGGNLPFYPPDIDLTLLDINPYMLRYLKTAAVEMDVQPHRLVVSQGEELPFLDNSFDTILTVHVLCSVRDQAKVLGEIRRVLRPGGRFLFIEHVAAEPHSPVHRRQQMINPVWSLVGDGCHLTRDTGTMIRMAGFKMAEITRFEAGYPAIVSPHVFGSAQT